MEVLYISNKVKKNDDFTRFERYIDLITYYHALKCTLKNCDLYIVAWYIHPEIKYSSYGCLMVVSVAFVCIFFIFSGVLIFVFIRQIFLPIP